MWWKMYYWTNKYKTLTCIGDVLMLHILLKYDDKDVY